jgi:two-component system alkaline phosphatase synthesis response regulator PhoP
MNTKKVMLVDDEEDIALLFKDGLEMYGQYKVDVYSNTQRAIDDFKPDFYDIILIDIIMPHMSGLEFYTAIRNKNHSSKICFFSASDYMDDKIKNTFPELKEQKTVLIQKPIKIKDLTNKIMEIIN